jgi:hypothetical protein
MRKKVMTRKGLSSALALVAFAALVPTAPATTIEITPLHKEIALSATSSTLTSAAASSRTRAL